MNLWLCNACDKLRNAPCAPVCLPADHYDPRDTRENAAIRDAENGTHHE